METYIQTGLGIIVSVLLFLIGYRQTVGARKERVKSANDKLIETILRRIILEKYTPKRDEVKRLIEGKARDHKVRVKDLLSVDQILNTLYTRIFENDLISQNERDENLERFSALFEPDKKEIKQEVELTFEKARDKNRKYFNLLIILLGTMSSVIGVSVVSFDKLTSINFDSGLNLSILGTMLASMAAVFTVYTFLRFKDSQESSEDPAGPKNPIKDHIKFEKEIQNQLKKLNIDMVIPTSRDQGFDFIANIKGEKTAIEVKYWRSRPPFAYVRQVVARLNSSMEKSNIKQGIILTRDTFDLGQRLRVSENIRIMTIADLKELIK
jgi:hypothetical protein